MLDIDTTIVANARLSGTKGLARKLRRAGQVPAIVYGPRQAPQVLALDPKSFVLQRRRFGVGTLYNLQAHSESGTQNMKCLIKDIQVDPISRSVLHVDLYAVDMTSELRVEVNIELTGKPAGIVDGGLLSQILRSVEVLCLPDRIPAKLVADVSALKIGDSLHMSDIKLPEGVQLTAHGDEAVALVAEPEDAPAETSPEAAAAATGAAAPAAAAGAAAKAPAKK